MRYTVLGVRGGGRWKQREERELDDGENRTEKITEEEVETD